MEAPSTDQRTCSGCNQPPRVTSEGKTDSLKRCSHCHAAWYHDSTCQRKHFPHHREDCLRLARQLRQPPSSAKRTSSQVAVVRKQNRGRCMETVAQLDSYEQISTPDGKASWPPLILPVLQSENRQALCAYCFSELGSRTFRNEKCPPHPQYMLLYCSKICRTQAISKHHFNLEEEALHAIYSTGSGPPKVLPTAIMVYRSILASTDKVIKKELDELHCEQPKGTPLLEDDYVSDHAQAVAITVAAMLQETPGWKRDMDTIKQLFSGQILRRVRWNSFSISDREGVALGLGLFGSVPCSMNHSCKPNAAQSFDYGRPGQSPRLVITTLEKVSSKTEICISYIDNDKPRHSRRPSLSYGYSFECNCERCLDPKHENKTFGMKCPLCKGEDVRRVNIEDEEPLDWKCAGCENRDFSRVLRRLRLLEMEGDCDSVEAATEKYREMQELCVPSSWFLQEAGDRLMVACCMKLSSSRWREMAVLTISVLDGWTGVHWKAMNRRYLAAKLQLMIASDPRPAIVELQGVRSELAKFYSPGHPVLTDIESVLRDALGK